MCRRARTGLVALIASAAIIWMLTPRLTPRAAAINGPYRIFLPGVVVPAPVWTASELEAFKLINQQRQANGCPPVTLNVELGIAAQAHSQDMATNNYFNHTGRNGSSFVERARAAGYAFQPSGEILAAGQSTPADAVRAWMNSSGHRAIILTCANDDVGVGLRESPTSTYRYYWTAVFGQR